MGTNNFTLVSTPDRDWIENKPLSRIPWLLHAFSTRKGKKASPPPARRSSNPALPGRDKLGLLAALGADDFYLAALRQIHSAIVYFVSSDGSASLSYSPSGYAAWARNRARASLSGDALITNQPGILLTVRVADCMPILLIDRKERAVAAIHAGWRGALSRVVEKTVGEMRRMFDSRPENLIAAIGPCVGSCCYEVGEEVVDAFSGRFVASARFFRRNFLNPDAANRRLPLFFSQTPPGHQAKEGSGVYLDLAAVARQQLEHSGVSSGRIHVADYCTACRNDLFYSYRREGSLAGRMVAAIGIRPDSD